MASTIEATARAFVEARSKHHIFSMQTEKAYQALVAAVAETEKDVALNEAYRQAAIEEWHVDGLEIDDDAVVSIGDGGANVAAWVYVSKEDAGIEDEDDEEEEA